MINAEDIFSRIDNASRRAGRDPKDITLVAVSKFQPIEKMLEYIEYCKGTSRKVVFGENYVQEFREKRERLPREISTHLIGHLQSNKANDAVELFDVIESVDSTNVARKLNAAAQKIGKKLEILLQVNISQDHAKGGFRSDEIEKSLSEILSLGHLKMTGLMTITELYEDPQDARIDFRALKVLRGNLQAQFPAIGALSLSMGMSDDFEYAIEEGATIVRIGSALFGARNV